DTAQITLKALLLTGAWQALALGQAKAALGIQRFELAQARDRMRDGLPVGQHAAEPARIDEVLRALARGFGDHRRGLALGAHEQHAAAAGHGIAHELQRAVKGRHGLAEIDDVDVVAHAEDESLHLGVPTVLLVTEVDARFEELTHGKIRQGHWLSFLCRLCLCMGETRPPRDTSPVSVWQGAGREYPCMWIYAA